jgi:phosphoglycerate kinase
MCDGMSENGYENWKYREYGTEEKRIYDIGIKSLIEIQKEIENHELIFWNGTMGWIENGYFSGSEMLYHLLHKSGKKVIVGGGDTAGFCNQFSDESFYHISTGGGASIEYISEGSLVGTSQFFV